MQIRIGSKDVSVKPLAFHFHLRSFSIPASKCQAEPILGMQNGATKCKLRCVCSCIFYISVVPLVLLPQPSFTLFAVISRHFSAAALKKQRSRGDCFIIHLSVLFCDCARDAETKHLEGFGTSERHGVRCTEALRLLYHVGAGMNILIAYFILNPGTFMTKTVFFLQGKFPMSLCQVAWHNIDTIKREWYQKLLQSSYCPEISNSFICVDGMKLSS